MNSEPHESAAWRTFGMLDADAAAAFDEAMRQDPELRNAYQEMERLSTAVAVTASTPIMPQAGQLERLHLRLGLNAAKRANWLGITGWAAAAVLTWVLVLDRNQDRSHRAVGQAAVHPGTGQPQSVVPPPPQNLTPEDDLPLTRVPGTIDDGKTATTHEDGDAWLIAQAESKRLVQEIEVLRGQLKSVLARDQQRFEYIPGMAWPIVVRMRPPQSFTDASHNLSEKLDDPAITSMLGDALTGANQPPALANPFAQRVFTPSVAPVPYREPSAMPIYDAARDVGTLVVSNLPAPAADEAYNLWVTTPTSDKPVYVGRLPPSNVGGGDSFDFSLGSKATVPSGFLLTKDRQGSPPLPSRASTVLQGPR